MASAFSQGFQLGGNIFNQAERNRLAKEDMEMRKAADTRAAELHRLAVGEKEDAARTRSEQYGLRTEMQDRFTGFDRSGFNGAANADFDAMLAASENATKAENAARANQRAGLAPPQGMEPAPQQPRISQDAELGLRAQYTRAPEINSSDFQSGMAGLRARYALAGGDMQDFDRVTTAERTRVNAAEDSDYVMRLQKNPNGPEAVDARSFINSNSSKLTTTVDDKTGITRFTIVKGDKAEDVFVSPSDLGKVAVGFRRLQRGDVGGLDVIAGVNKDLAAVAREELKVQMQAITGNNDAVSKIEKIKSDREELGVKRSYYDARAAAEKMGTAQSFNGDDGNTYMVIPKMGAGGKVTTETVRVNPEGVKMKKPGGEGGGKPVTVQEEGTRVMLGDRLHFADGRGGYIPAGKNAAPVGVLPSQRPAALKAAGVPENFFDRLDWSPDGTEVGYNGLVFGVDELKLIPRELARISRGGLAVEEANRSSAAAHSPRSAIPAGPGRPVGPWDAYSQANR